MKLQVADLGINGSFLLFFFFFFSSSFFYYCDSVILNYCKVDYKVFIIRINNLIILS